MTGTNSTPKAAGRDSELKELAITAIKQHPNYRGKPLGRLPYIIDKLVLKADWKSLATELEKKKTTTEAMNRLADVTVQHAKKQSQQDGQPCDFSQAKKAEQK